MTLNTEGKSNLVPQYVRASSPDNLREAMLINNLRMKAQVFYQDIQFCTDGYWYAWFYEEVDFYSKLKPKKA